MLFEIFISFNLAFCRVIRENYYIMNGIQANSRSMRNLAASKFSSRYAQSFVDRGIVSEYRSRMIV